MIIEGCHSLAAIQDAVRTFSKPYGYDRYVPHSASSMSDEIVERIYWVEGDRCRLRPRCSVRHCLTRSYGHCWAPNLAPSLEA